MKQHNPCGQGAADPEQHRDGSAISRYAISQIFGEPVPGGALAGHATVLSALQAGIAGQLAVLEMPA